MREVEPGLFILPGNVLPQVVHAKVPVILWITFPGHHHLAEGIYGEQLVVFDICDLPEEEFEYWKQDFDEALGRAGLVFAASYLLYEKYRERHHNIHYVPNAVDYKAFQHFGTQPHGFPQRPGPVAGFHGALASWMDWNLVYHIAKRLFRWNFVFIGPLLNITRDQLPYGENIFYLEERPFTELTDYTNYFDVGIIPFQIREMTRYSCPIKLYEYLSCGKPVVSTPIHEVCMCPVAKIGRNAQEFAAHIENVFAECISQPDLADNYKFWARKNSWEKRVFWIDKMIRDTLATGLG